MNVKITRASDAAFHLGQVVSEEDYANMVYLVWYDGGEIPLGEATSESLDKLDEAVVHWFEDGYDRNILRCR